MLVPTCKVSQRGAKISSYEAVFKEVDVRVPPVIKGGVNGADHPRETLRDGPRIATAFRVLSEYPVLLAVIPPKPSSCIQQQLRQKKNEYSLFKIRSTFVGLPLKK